MYYMYSLKGFDYVSLYQNHLTSSTTGAVCANNSDCEIYPFDNFVINQGITQKMLQYMIDHVKGNTVLFFDMRHICHKPIHSLELLAQLTIWEQYKSVLYICDNPELARLIKDYLVPNDDMELLSIDKDGLCFIFGNKEVNAELLTQYPNIETIEETISAGIAFYVFNQLRVKESKPWLIKSSNVFANRYFNVRKIFCDYSLFHLVVFQMAWMVISHVKEITSGFDAFICASVNGAFLASGLSVYFKKPVIFLRNVGPQMATSDERLAERIISGKKYIYIFDFMCLGTEFQRIKMLTNIRKAKIISCIGVSHYKHPLDKTNQSTASSDVEHLKFDSIYTLFNINEFDNGYYRCFAEEQDCNEFIENRKGKNL